MQDPRVIFEEAHRAHQAGRLDEARGLYERVLEAAPEAHPAHGALTILCRQLDDIDSAVGHGEAAVAASPDSAPYHYHLADALLAGGQTDAAIESYRRVLDLDPKVTPAWINLGIALHDSGRFADAAEAYRGAPAEAQGDPVLHYNLGNTLVALDDKPGAAAAFRRAVAIAPDFAAAHFNLGHLLESREDYGPAAAAYRQSVALNPDHDEAHINLGNALAEAGQRDEAIAVLRELVGRRPDFIDGTYNLASALLENGRTQEALDLCRNLSGHSRRHCGLIACQAIALAELGDDAGARTINDYERLVRSRQVSAPPGYSDLAAFNAALQEHILAHPTLRADPYGHATRYGEHTGELFAEPWGPMGEMKAAIETAIGEYLAGLPEDHGHPFLSVKPTDLRLTAWAVVMGDRGHQIAHIHPAAWVSGVYYVEVPEVVESSGEDREGWLQFGRPGEEFDVSFTPELMSVKPEAGLMVLFPAYMYHHTVPYRSRARRISLAFDAVAEE